MDFISVIIMTYLYSCWIWHSAANSDIGNVDLFEGDMAGIDPENLFSALLMRGSQNGITFQSIHWPNGVIPYEFSSEYSTSQKIIIISAMADFHIRSCVRFIERTIQTDYVYITPGSQSRCWSYVGKVGGQQLINLHPSSCLTVSTIQHELAHTIGFLHEQSRFDRDEYVDINWNNIREDRATRNQFRSYANSAIMSYGQPYDFSSLTHYKQFDFAVDKTKWTIRPKQQFNSNTYRPGENLSETDIKKINLMYQCSSLQKKLTEAIRHVGCGYDLLKGNPDGVPVGYNNSDTDPGLKSNKVILYQTQQKNQWCFNETTCSEFSQVRTEDHWVVEANLQQFQKARDMAWNTWLDSGSPSLYKSRGLGSRMADEFVREFWNGQGVFIAKRQLITNGGIMYDYYDHTRLSDEFTNAVCQLPQEFISSVYYQFIREWGTHVVVGGKFGSLVINWTIIPKDEFVARVAEKYRDDVISDAGKICINDFFMDDRNISELISRMFLSDSQQYHGNQTGRSQRGFNNEGLSLVTYNLRPINYFIDLKFFRLSVQQTQNCQSFRGRLLKTKLAQIQTHITRAMESYPNVERISLQVTNNHQRCNIS